MAQTLLIRNVSDLLKTKAKENAKIRGQSLNAYLREVLEHAILTAPPAHSEPAEKFLRRLHDLPIDTSGFDSTAYIRKIRNAGD